MTIGERWTSAAVALAIPGCLLAVASVGALSLAAVGRYPMWRHLPLNLGESAGARDEAEVVRLIERGDNPDARYPIRPGILSNRPLNLLPLEAAIARDDRAIVSQLLSKGASLDAGLWSELRCFAGERTAPILDEHRPAAAARPQCGDKDAPWD